MASLQAEPGHADSFAPAWVVGACIGVSGSTLSSLGLVLQKLAHSRRSAADALRTPCDAGRGGRSSNLGGRLAVAAAAAYVLQPWWLLGFGVFLAAGAVNMVSMAMTPQLILSCLGSWSLVCNLVFANLLLGERICRKQARAMAALVPSIALVLYTAPRPQPGEEPRDENIEALSARFLRPEFDALTLVLLSLAAMACAWLRCVRWRLRPAAAAPGRAGSTATFVLLSFPAMACARLRGVRWRLRPAAAAPGRAVSTATSVAAAGDASSIASSSPLGASAATASAAVVATTAVGSGVELEDGKAPDDIQDVGRWAPNHSQPTPSAWRFPGAPLLVASAWVLVAAISTGYTALLFKCLAELIAGMRTAPSSPLLHWETYLLLASALTVATFELHCLNLALRSGDAVKVVPLYLSLGMIAHIILGGVFFQEFEDFRSVADVAAFAGSVVATLVSVAALVRAGQAAAQACGGEVAAAAAAATAAADAAGVAAAPAPGKAIWADVASGEPPGVPSDGPTGAPGALAPPASSPPPEVALGPAAAPGQASRPSPGAAP